jgi:hypothetical protein
LRSPRQDPQRAGETEITRERLRDIVEDVVRDTARFGSRDPSSDRVMTIQRAKNRHYMTPSHAPLGIAGYNHRFKNDPRYRQHHTRSVWHSVLRRTGVHPDDANGQSGQRA